MLWIILFVMVALAVSVYLYRNKLAAFLPGFKHAIAAVAAFILAVVQYFQTLNWSELLHDPTNAALAAAGVGLLVLLLSWVTPRKDA